MLKFPFSLAIDCLINEFNETVNFMAKTKKNLQNDRKSSYVRRMGRLEQERKNEEKFKSILFDCDVSNSERILALKKFP